LAWRPENEPRPARRARLPRVARLPL